MLLLVHKTEIGSNNRINAFKCKGNSNDSHLNVHDHFNQEVDDIFLDSFNKQYSYARDE